MPVLTKHNGPVTFVFVALLILSAFISRETCARCYCSDNVYQCEDETNSDIEISFTPCSLNFVQTDKGLTSSLNLMITNSGNQTVTVMAVDVTSDVFSVDLSGGAEIGVNATLPVLVQFKPDDDKSYNAKLRIIFSETINTFSISLSGRGFEYKPTAPQVSCTPQEIDFGAVEIGAEEYKKVICTNSGEESASLISLSITGEETDVFSITDYSEIGEGVTIGGGESKDLWLQFVPLAGVSYKAEVNLLWDYSDEAASVSLNGHSDPVGEAQYEYYRYSEIQERFMAYQGQGQLFILELQGAELALTDIQEQSYGMQLDTILEIPAVKSALGQNDREGHYIYALYRDQMDSIANPHAQMNLLNFDMNSVFNMLSMGGVLDAWPEWNGNAVPRIKVKINDGKAVYVESGTTEISFAMNVDFSWRKAPAGVETGDVYILLVNQSGSRNYCYDLQDQAFERCGTVYPSISEVAPSFSYRDIAMPFNLPVDETGVWRIFVGLVADDGSVFYDQAALIVKKALNGEMVEVY